MFLCRSGKGKALVPKLFWKWSHHVLPHLCLILISRKLSALNYLSDQWHTINRASVWRAVFPCHSSQDSHADRCGKKLAQVSSLDLLNFLNKFSCLRLLFSAVLLHEIHFFCVELCWFWRLVLDTYYILVWLAICGFTYISWNCTSVCRYPVSKMPTTTCRRWLTSCREVQG